MLANPTPGQRVRLIDPNSPRKGALGTVDRSSPETTAADGQTIPALVYVKLQDSIWTLPYYPHDLEPVV